MELPGNRSTGKRNPAGEMVTPFGEVRITLTDQGTESGDRSGRLPGCPKIYLEFS